MKIIYNLFSTEKIFNGLSIGDVFIDGDGDVCMKTANRYSDNAVMLEDGCVVSINLSSIVIPVKATLTIEGDE